MLRPEPCAQKSAWHRPKSSSVWTAENSRPIAATGKVIGNSTGILTIEQHNESRREIAMRMSVVARKLRKDFDRHMADIGVTRSQWMMIAIASRRPGATQRQISELLEMSEASAGRLIDRLCVEGLLERREQDNDRRARCVFITEAAKPVLERLSEIGRQAEERLFKNFTDDDVNVFGRLLTKIYGNITAPD